MGSIRGEHDWDEEPTLVHGRAAEWIAPIPPPLPAHLNRVHKNLSDDDRWLETLPAAARAVLEDARRPRTLEAPAFGTRSRSPPELDGLAAVPPRSAPPRSAPQLLAEAANCWRFSSTVRRM